MKKRIRQARQGDVFLRISELPKELKEKDRILAYGEDFEVLETKWGELK